MDLKIWKVEQVDKENSAQIAEEYQIPHVLAILLEQRTNGSRNEIENFLTDEGLSESPFEIADMEKASDRIRLAVESQEKITIYGDYDADGVTATSIMYNYLTDIGADVTYYIPQREGEGYGMNSTAVKKIHENGTKLIVTVDNGIAAVEEVNLANSLGMEVIVTDHHMPPEILPNAYAIVNPHRKDCPSYFKEYSGAGIALKLLLAMEFDFSEEEDILRKYSDLACIGTIADIVPVIGENRTIIKNGLLNLQDSERIGISAIIEKASMSEINTNSVAFGIAPRINATGRMGSPERAVKLLTTNDEEESKWLAEDICAENERRKEVENQIIQEAIMQIENNNEIKYARVIVVAGENWHPGVIGIVSSKITEIYGKPSMVISFENGIGVGSGRSVEGFSIFKALSYSGGVLVRFGGHPMAAGLTIEKKKLEQFRNLINEYARINYDIMPVPEIRIDLKLQPTALSINIPEQISVLEPFGTGNPSPVFGLYNMKLQSIVPVGQMKNHLRLTFNRDGKQITAMLFSCTKENFPYAEDTVLDLAVTLESKTFRGEKNLSISVKAMKPSNIDVLKQIRANGIYEKFMRKEKIQEEEIEFVFPSRDDIAIIYRMIRSNTQNRFTVLQMLANINSDKINVAKIYFSLKALEESGLVKLRESDFIEIEIIPTNKKVDIMNTEILRKIKN